MHFAPLLDKESCTRSDAKYKKPNCQHILRWLQAAYKKRVSKSSDVASWTDEQKTQSSHEWQSFFDHKRNVKGYCSFILAEQQTVERFFKQLNGVFGTNNNFPLGPERGQFPKSWNEKGETNSAAQTDSIWFFVGRNDGSSILNGRPKHTDAVLHDLTWHEQLCGTKTWKLELTKTLLEVCPHAKPVTLYVRAGDVLIIDTKTWWHCTHIEKSCPLSISYARDVILIVPFLERVI